MKNITKLRTELIQVFNDLKKDKIEITKAKELSNCAGKILKSVAIEINYNSYMEKKKKINFLE